MNGSKITPYYDYRESEVEWLRKVPNHWEVRRMKTFLAAPLQYGANEAADLDDRTLPRFVRITDIDDSGALRDETFRSLPRHLAQPYLLNDDDILLARSGGTVGKSFIYSTAWGEACFAGYLIRARLRRCACIPKFFYYFCQTPEYWNYIDGSQIQATIQNVSAEKYANLHIPLPPSDEQKQIAAFLDYETAKIDALIAMQQQLIALLGEKRQAVISHAVTKGLNPDAPMRDSGIEWLGEVPEHWEVVNLNVVAEIGNGSTPDRSTPRYWGEQGDFPWLNSSVVNQVAVNESDQFVTESALRECHLPHIMPPAVLVGITGQGKTRGMATILQIEATINQHVTFIQPRDGRVTVPFIHRFFQMAYDHIRFESEGAGSTKGAITCGQLEKTKIPLPPSDEQTQIVDHLCDFSTKIAELIHNAEEANELLQERRTALISAAVTGKIDVRGWKPPSSHRGKETEMEVV